MDPSSPSSSRRDDATPQGNDLQKITSRIEWDVDYNVDAVSEDDVNAVSDDDKGPRIGQGAWVGDKWHDPLDPHPFEPRQICSREEFDPDYKPEARQVMHTRLFATTHTIFFIDYV